MAIFGQFAGLTDPTKPIIPSAGFPGYQPAPPPMLLPGEGYTPSDLPGQDGPAPTDPMAQVATNLGLTPGADRTGEFWSPLNVMLARAMGQYIDPNALAQHRSEHNRNALRNFAGAAGIMFGAGALLPGGIGGGASSAGGAAVGGGVPAGGAGTASITIPGVTAGTVPGLLPGGGVLAGGNAGVLGSLSGAGPIANMGGAGVLAAGGGGGFMSNLGNFVNNQVLGGGSVMDRVGTGLGLFSDLYGQYQQGQAQNDALDAMRGATLGPLSWAGGGITANDAGFDLGPLSGLQQGLAGAAGNQFGNINFASGIPPEIAQALQGFQRFTNTVGGLPEQFLGSAGTLGQELGQGYDATRASTLDQLRARALPENQRTVNSALSRLFATGSLGTTGGANILGRLAEAQNQQDLGFQLAAGDESRAAASSVADRFGALFGAGRDLGRFGADVAGENLGYTRDMAVLPQALRGTQLSEVGQLLQLFGGLQTEGRNAFGEALSLAGSRANAANSVASNIGNFVGSPNYSASPLADLFGTIFSTRSQNRQMQRLFEQMQGSA